MEMEVYILWMIAAGFMAMMGAFVLIRKVMIHMQKNRNTNIFILPPGNEKLEHAETSAISGLYFGLSSDFDQCRKSKAVHRFVR